MATLTDARPETYPAASSTTSTPAPLMLVKEFAAKYGISQARAYEEISTGRLACYRPTPNRIRISDAQALAWLQRGGQDRG